MTRGRRCDASGKHSGPGRWWAWARCVVLAVCLGIALLCSAACGGQVTATVLPDETITIAGESDVIPIVLEMADSFAKGRAALHFESSITPAAQALARVGGENAVIAVVTQHPDSNTAALRYTEIARQPILVIVHPDNAIKSLSYDDLAAIYSGRSTDWSQAGGPAMPIMVLSREPAAPLRQRLDSTLLGADVKLTPNALLLPSDEAIVVTVARRPEAIGYITGSGNPSGVKTLAIEGEHPLALVRGRAYPLWQSILLVTPARASAYTTAFLAYVKSRQGQRVVASWGYGQGVSDP